MSDQTADSSSSKSQSALQSLSSILTLPPSLSSSPNPALSLLHDPDVAAGVSALLRRPGSGVGDDPLCRWLYDTFQSSSDDGGGFGGLRLVVLRFLPALAGAYLSRVALRRPLAGFEAVLLALYAHETAARDGRAVTVTVPDLSNPSVYHAPDAVAASGPAASSLHIAVVTPSLEPHGTVRSTRRARIVGVALELYYGKIDKMPDGSKIDFCEFCQVWAGQNGGMYGNDNDDGEEPSGAGEGIGEGRIHMPWELMHPVLRILGHCLLGQSKGGGSGDKGELKAAAAKACRSLHARAVHDVNPRAILATESLLRLEKMAAAADASQEDWDPTEIPNTRVISL